MGKLSNNIQNGVLVVVTLGFARKKMESNFRIIFKMVLQRFALTSILPPNLGNGESSHRGQMTKKPFPRPLTAGNGLGVPGKISKICSSKYSAVPLKNLESSVTVLRLEIPMFSELISRNFSQRVEFWELGSRSLRKSGAVRDNF